MKPKKTILCVDDNEQSLSIRKIMLETRGYRVLSFANGADALAAFKSGGIDHRSSTISRTAASPETTSTPMMPGRSLGSA